MAMLLVFNQRIIDKLNYLIDDPEFDVIYEIKSDINDEDGFKFHRKNYYKLNNL